MCVHARVKKTDNWKAALKVILILDFIFNVLYYKNIKLFVLIYNYINSTCGNWLKVCENTLPPRGASPEHGR